jgi:hypothetical protein
VLSNLVSEYDNKIRPKLLEVFSVQGPIKDPEAGEVVAQNTLDWADYLGDGDGKLSILILGISKDPNGNSLVAGYFMPHNFYAKTDTREPIYEFSNESDMLYISAHLLGTSDLNTTLAHETQHLMNFANSTLFRRYYDEEWGMWDFHQMDTWVDEGLSSAAEYVYLEQHNKERLYWFNDLGGIPSARGSKIREGNNFFVWGERAEANAILDEYATVYLFFQWLKLQSGGTNQIYRDISTAKTFHHQAVVDAIRGKGNYNTKPYLETDPNLAWATLLKDWLVANAMTTADFDKYPNGTTASSLRHSYMKNPLLSTITTAYYPQEASSTVYLYPGEGVYSWTNTAKTFQKPSDKNIRYTGMKEGAEMVEGASQANGVLLTYNINTANGIKGELPLAEWRKEMAKLREPGNISMDSPPSTLSFVMNSKVRAVFDSHEMDRLFKPQAISMEDMLKARGHEGFLGGSPTKR